MGGVGDSSLVGFVPFGGRQVVQRYAGRVPRIGALLQDGEPLFGELLSGLGSGLGGLAFLPQLGDSVLKPGAARGPQQPVHRAGPVLELGDRGGFGQAELPAGQGVHGGR